MEMNDVMTVRAVAALAASHMIDVKAVASYKNREFDEIAKHIFDYIMSGRA